MLKRLVFTLLFGALASGCQLFGGDDDSMDEGLDAELDAVGDSYDESYSEDSFGDDSDVLGDEDTYSEDSSLEGDTYLDGMGGSMSGNVYFVTSDLAVYSSPDGTSQVLFQLSAGDTIRGEISGEYASIGYGYVLASGLSETVVERIPTVNAWR